MSDADLIAAVEVSLADAGELDRSAAASLLSEVAWSLGDFTDHPPVAITFGDESIVEVSEDAVDSRLKRLRECRRAVRPLESRDAARDRRAAGGASLARGTPGLACREQTGCGRDRRKRVGRAISS